MSHVRFTVHYVSQLHWFTIDRLLTDLKGDSFYSVFKKFQLIFGWTKKMFSQQGFLRFIFLSSTSKETKMFPIEVKNILIKVK